MPFNVRKLRTKRNEAEWKKGRTCARASNGELRRAARPGRQTAPWTQQSRGHITRKLRNKMGTSSPGIPLGALTTTVASATLSSIHTRSPSMNYLLSSRTSDIDVNTNGSKWYERVPGRRDPGSYPGTGYGDRDPPLQAMSIVEGIGGMVAVSCIPSVAREIIRGVRRVLVTFSRSGSRSACGTSPRARPDHHNHDHDVVRTPTTAHDNGTTTSAPGQLPAPHHNYADGPSFMTQCPIAAGNSFLHDFDVLDHHSHLGGK
ncbi:hypothetical protein BDZ89DRAFT_1050447 [Hymenopellis radicata]|nr:hypothetical protein BDZ89DRAFT_1050447 [Hymenopellis radicata]